MKKVLIISVGFLLSISAGCSSTGRNKELLTVDFQKDKVLRYELMTNRYVTVNWEPGKKPDVDKNKPADWTEFTKIVVAYKPVEVNPYGLSVIEAKCESVTCNRSKHGGQQPSKIDAVNSLSGKTFRFTIGPNGQIMDYSQLDEAVKQAGQKAFRPRSKMGLIKDPDMISDFIAEQWFLWDSISSIKNPAQGISVGQSWESQMSLPLPMIMKAARDVKYTLSAVHHGDKGDIAVINSDYYIAKNISRNWPLPYPDGSFQMSGPFGFFRNYKLLELKGSGEELFNIDAGRLESYDQKYDLKMEAGLPMGIDITTHVHIEQIIRAKLLE